MQTLHFIGIFLLLGLSLSCTDDKELSQEEENEYILQLFTEIETLANSQTCTDSSEWKFTAYGSKACGGPVGYIAYADNIDTVLFLEKIEEHESAQQAYNQKWGIISDCSVPAQPSGIRCEDGEPVFEY